MKGIFASWLFNRTLSIYNNKSDGNEECTKQGKNM